MNKNKRGIFVIILLLLIIAVLYYLIIYKKKDPFAPLSQKENFEALQQGLGITTTGNRLTVKFNLGANQADYYDNGRLVIGKIGTAGYQVKGSYKDGGKSIYLDTGKTITAQTPWASLEQTII